MLISGGGTGGHVYPLLVVAEALQTEWDDVDLLYVGSPEGMEKPIVARTDLPYRAVDSGPIRGTTPWALAQNVARLWRGYRQARATLAEWRADVVLVTGGYVSVPVSLAARREDIPVMVYLPDREPGWAVRFLSRFVERVAVSFDEARRAFPASVQHKIWVSGYPVRGGLLELDRAAGCRSLDLDPGRKTLLVLGGSRGARSLNQALVAALPDLLAHYQVVHASGTLDWPWVSEECARLPAELRGRYRPYAYLHGEFEAAMAVADLVVARAGAATMAEFPAAGLPSVLVPYPYAGQHQGLNADFMAAHGAALRVEDEDLALQFRPTVMRLLGDDVALARMAENARALARPDAARRLALELGRMAGAVAASADPSAREESRGKG